MPTIYDRRFLPVKLILFDIDSTLVSVARPVIQSLTRRLLGEALDYHEALEGYELHGKTDRQIIRELREIAGDATDGGGGNGDVGSAMERMIVEHWRDHLNEETVELMPGVTALLDDLDARDDVALGLLTGNLEESAHLKLAIHDLDRYFPFGAYGSDSERRVELPPIALDRARMHHGIAIEYDRTLIVGDSHRDIECARAWGIRALAVATGSLDLDTLRSHGPDAAVESLLDRTYLDTFLDD
ncbi:MAG TPA: HAD hydrolase-like protein [Candidatus Kapabacteria bacterium]|nr:HAD hydrolase-like protein [Candidatus Kapabacteria bacterium]